MTDMSEKDDGGPGPQIKVPDVTPDNGVTLRDWFAGQALVGLVASYAGSSTSFDFKGDPLRAYQYADAMLAARKREGGQ